MEPITKDIKLSASQVQQLFVFVEKKFVRWYDLQIEIVDHLASAIEMEMKSAPALSFESALEKVYKSFGIFGFAKIVQERQNHLANAARRTWWMELRNLFRWPRIILFFMIVSAVYTLATSVESHMLGVVFFAIYVTLSTLFFIYIIKDNRVQQRLLLLQSGSAFFSVPVCFELAVAMTYTILSPVSFTVLLTTGILIKITSFTVYRKVREKATLLYPSAFLKPSR